MMNIAQAAAEAIQPTGSAQITTWIAVAVLAVAQIGGWLKIIFIDGRRARAQAEKENVTGQKLAGYPEGSVGAILWDHANKITIHDVEIKNISDRMAEIRSDNRLDHTAIVGKIDTLKDQLFDKFDEIRVGK